MNHVNIFINDNQKILFIADGETIGLGLLKLNNELVTKWNKCNTKRYEHFKQFSWNILNGVKRLLQSFKNISKIMTNLGKIICLTFHQESNNIFLYLQVTVKKKKLLRWSISRLRVEITLFGSKPFESEKLFKYYLSSWTPFLKRKRKKQFHVTRNLSS